VVNVLIHEVCKECRLTKKAVEYYVEQALVSPAILENGYRCFSRGDIERLKKIAVLRGLGLAVSDIQGVLDNDSAGALRRVSHEKKMEIVELREKQALLENLAQDGDWENALVRTVSIEKKQSILHRLLGLFPGYYGKYVSMHFASYLNEPIATEEQQEAFEAIIGWLDGANLIIPDDLKDFFDETSKDLGKINVADMDKNIAEAIKNPEQYMDDNKETIERYLAYKESDEYKQSPSFRLREVLAQFQAENGYNNIFIPAMKRLSGTYKKYHDDLIKANGIFIKKYGDRLDG
jgi:DNA-binding transcriptional MerR regulator